MGSLRGYNSVKTLASLFDNSQLIYYTYYRLYEGHKLLSLAVSLLIRFLSIFPLDRLPQYKKLSQSFDMKKKDFGLYLVDKLDSLVKLPNLKGVLIAVFEKE